MIRLTCMQVRALMDQRAQGLSDADRLRVESHTVRCAACADHSAVLSSLVSLAQSAPAGLGDAARQRAITRALNHPIASETVTPPLAVWPRWALSGGVVLALAAAALVLRPSFGNAPDAQPSTAQQISQAPQPAVASVEARPTVERFEADAPRRVEIEGATLELSAHSTIEWDAAAARVTLRRGTVRAVVASRVGRTPFSVRASRFDVVVVGTDFLVSEHSVTVHEGVVRIQDHSGRVLREALHAGEVWRRDGVVASSTAPHAHKKSANTGDTVGAPRWIAEARTWLASGDVTRALQALERAEPRASTTAQRLEVLTLRAEAYQVAGKNRQAVAQYDRVRSLDSSSPAADNADFAAARLTLSSGDRPHARTRFERYLKNHPTGRFRSEVERVLTTLRVTDETTTRSAP